MKITLQKDHMSPEGTFKAGETIEVDEATYDWLMSIYLAERQQDLRLAEEYDKKVTQLRKQGKTK